MLDLAPRDFPARGAGSNTETGPFLLGTHQPGEVPA